jgi:Uncharacterized conserved protein
MATIQIKRVYEPITPSDGYRILVDRLWPRGIKKENLKCDYWAKELAPSNELRQWYHADMEGRRPEFAARYLDELNHSTAAENFLHTLESQKTITLLFSAKDTVHTHALTLQKWMEKHL